MRVRLRRARAALTAVLLATALAAGCSDGGSTAPTPGGGNGGISTGGAPGGGETTGTGGNTGGGETPDGQGQPGGNTEPAKLKANPNNLDLGTKSSGSFVVENAGDTTLTWNGAPEVNWLTISPERGKVNPGKTQRVTVHLDGAPEGDLAGTIGLASNGGTQTVNVKAQVNLAPRITNLVLVKASSGARLSTVCVGTAVAVQAVARDSSGLASFTVAMGWTGPGGVSGTGGTTRMQKQSGVTYRSTDFGTPDSANYLYKVTATDATGKVTQRTLNLRMNGAQCGTVS